jgi:hypothetical protein
LLHEPIPARYSPHTGDDRLLLCDLDESSWERFGEETCRQLADEVVRAVGRAARMPMPIGDRRLPPIPRGMKLADLDLEMRTVNCLVAAGIHERPQDLRTLSIEGILGLRGFWVKCLVDLLTSLEHVTDHPEVRRKLRVHANTPIKGARVSGRYPRAGDRLAPATLREILAVPVPPELAGESGARDLELCDLDESVWDRFETDQIVRLAGLIVARVNGSGCNRTVRRRRLPKPPARMRLEDLRLENRTYNCLHREGFGKRPEELGNRTVGDLLAIKAFGGKCLVDLLSSLETLAARGSSLDPTLTTEAESLAELPEASQVHFSDPRLGGMLRAADTEANTTAELAGRVAGRRVDPPNPMALGRQIGEIRRRIRQLTGQSLEDELVEIFSPVSSGRDREIVAGYYGWDGEGRRTLEELGKRHGLSRERIRQVCVRATKRIRGAKVFAPVLDRTLAFIADRLPREGARLQAEVDSAGFSACRLPLETIHEAARLLSRKPRFELAAVSDVRLAVKPDDVELPAAVVQTAKRAVLSYGAATIRDVAAEVASQRGGKTDRDLVAETLTALADFEWLSERQGWFRLESLPQYGLPNLIEKVLSVAGCIDVVRLRSAVARYRRIGRRTPPAGALLEFCRRMSGVRVEGNTVVGDPPRDWRQVLAGVEADMVRVLSQGGPVMERGRLEDLCTAEGVNRFSFNAVIMSSPVIAQYGRSVYGLVGKRVDRRVIRSLVARRPGAAGGKVLRKYGRTTTGRVYLAYRLSKAAISGGVVTVPAAMKDYVRGKFPIRKPDGDDAGTLVSKSGCAWGLGPALRGHGAEPGDHLLILLDPTERVAEIHIGDENLVESADAPAVAAR